tara:strand:- start:87472 stop:89463 length:1992 start_codon:yes stop_codon:yes gene_type:complete
MGVTHMMHPFDLPNVKTGKDLLNFFQKAEEYLRKNSAAVKIDGTNVPIKLIDGDFGKQFAGDRGSLFPADVVGLTKKNVETRFKAGHGFIDIIPSVAAAFDAAFPKIKKELQALGMMDDSSIYLNTEFLPASGLGNVIQYGSQEGEDPINTIAIHNLSQFYSKEAKTKGKVSRPGLPRPTDPITKKPITDAATEIAYDESVMASLIQKMNAEMKKQGLPYKVFGSVPTNKLNIDINLSEVLNSPVSILLDEEATTKSLGEWLSFAINPKRETIELNNGNTVAAVNKQIYQLIIPENPNEATAVAKILANPERDYKKTIDGAVFYHATRLLGQAILDPLDSELGPIMDHEGIVLRDKIFGANPVKITGNFILGGLASSFKRNESLSEEEHPVGENSVVFIPGGFKPPHKGHIYLIKTAIEQAKGSKPYIVTGETKRDGITLEQSKRILDLYLKNEEVGVGFSRSELDILFVPESGVPMLDAEGREKLRKDGNPILTNSPLQVIYNKSMELPPDTTIFIASSTADPAHASVGKSIKQAREDLDIRPLSIEIPEEYMDPKTGDKLSATVLRKAIKNNDFERFKDFVPDSSLKNAGFIFHEVLGGGQRSSHDEPFQSPDLSGVEDEELDEMSVSTGVGAMGYMGRPRKRKKQLKELFINDVLNYLVK